MSSGLASRGGLANFHEARGILYAALWRLLSAELSHDAVDEVRREVETAVLTLDAPEPWGRLLETIAEHPQRAHDGEIRGVVRFDGSAEATQIFRMLDVAPSEEALDLLWVLHRLAAGESQAIRRNELPRAAELGELQLRLLDQAKRALDDLSAKLSASPREFLQTAGAALAWLIYNDARLLDLGNRLGTDDPAQEA